MPRKANGPVRIGACSIIPQPGGGWRASVPRPRGQGRIRKRFRTLSDAQKWVRANLSTVGVCDPLTPKEAVEYRDARALLPPGASIVDAAKAYAPAIITDVSTAESTAEYIDAKRDAGRRHDTVRDYRYALSRLPSCQLSEITPAVITASLEGLNPRRRNNVLASLRTFFRWAVANKHIASDPTAAIDKASIDWTPPKIYTPGQTRIMFALAEEIAPELVPYLSISAFAGVRTSGVMRLAASSVDMKGRVIEVSGFADKLRRGYIATVSDTLAAWLEAYPFRPWKKTFHAFSTAYSRFLAKVPFPTVRNGLRHSFASYLYASTRDANAVAAALGHLGEVETLLRSYRRLASPQAAQSYFSIRPTLR